MAVSEKTKEDSSTPGDAVAGTPVKKRAARKKASAASQPDDSPRALNAADLASLCLGYRLRAAPGRTLQIPDAKRLATLQAEAFITIEGRLLPRQSSQLDIKAASREIKIRQRTYAMSRDNSVRLRVGSEEGQPHLECKLYLKPSLVAVVNAAIGKPVIVHGFFRCTLRDTGIWGPAYTPDAHLFEINPVTSLAIEGEDVIAGTSRRCVVPASRVGSMHDHAAAIESRQPSTNRGRS